MSHKEILKYKGDKMSLIEEVYDIPAYSAEELYDIPGKQNIPLADLEKADLISAQMCKRLYHQGKFPLIRIGSKFFAPRKQVIKWLDEQLNANTDAV